MSVLVPFLVQCADKRCGVPSPVVDAPELVRWLAQNQLRLCLDTVADGNCGIHAFYLSLVDFVRHSPGLKTSAAWKQLSKTTSRTADVIQHLRGVAVKWMQKNADIEVWDGMTFRELACKMSHLQEPYNQHLDRMATDGEWVDASVIHALACAFQVDVAIWQRNQDPMLIGYALSRSLYTTITTSGVLSRLKLSTKGTLIHSR